MTDYKIWREGLNYAHESYTVHKLSYDELLSCISLSSPDFIKGVKDYFNITIEERV